MDRITEIQQQARAGGSTERPRWPMIVLRTPKGWTGPKEVDGKPAEGNWRSHQVPFSKVRGSKEHLKLLEDWMRSYRPEELFDDTGAPVEEIRALAPRGERRMSANPHANGGLLLRALRMPDFRDYAVEVEKPGTGAVESTRVLGGFLRDVMVRNADARNFRVFSPDENNSNRLQDLLEVTQRRGTPSSSTATTAWRRRPGHGDPVGAHLPGLARGLSAHRPARILLLLRGLHPHHRLDVQPAREVAEDHARARVAAGRSLAQLPAHVARLAPDHNGFSHQDPGFIDHVVNKKADVIRVYLPPDANTLLSVGDHCLRSRNYVNVIVAGKQPALQYLDMDAAIKHCTKGIGIWDWASNDRNEDGTGAEPDVVMGCAGDVPTQETLAAVDLLRGYFPDLKVASSTSSTSCACRTTRAPARAVRQGVRRAVHRDKPIIFAYHGYPWLITGCTYRDQPRQPARARLQGGGTTSTPFDMCVMNDIDRFHLAIDVIDRVPGSARRPRTPARTCRTSSSPTTSTYGRRRGPAGGPRLAVDSLTTVAA
jgi:xylulose-5-phosphate/fructose-6-phosphate phosphoketolase